MCSDDARQDGKPGEFTAKPVIPTKTLSPLPFSHHIDPSALLEYARDLCGTRPEGVLCPLPASRLLLKKLVTNTL